MISDYMILTSNNKQAFRNFVLITMDGYFAVILNNKKTLRTNNDADELLLIVGGSFHL